LREKILKESTITRFFLHIFLLAIGYLFLFPIIVMVLGSFKTAVELSANPAGFPLAPTIRNYYEILVANTFIIRGIGNSAFITASYILVNLFLSSMAAYAFAKFSFPGKNGLFILLLATMMIPKHVLLPPLYIIFARIGWLNTYRVQIFADAANVFGVFMLRQYFENIPDGILEAAQIDGATHFGLFRRFVLPMSVPAIGAFSILQFNHKWNDYLFPVLFIRDMKKLPIMAVLPRIQTMEGNEQMVPWELILAGCTFVTIPVIIFFLIFQDKVMTSMTAGAVKE
jgi:ABC-type glycerol-3-phosphate transport system permease component